MQTIHTTPKGIEISDNHVFAIRLFIYTATDGDSNLPIKSILNLVDIFDEFRSQKNEIQ